MQSLDTITETAEQSRQVLLRSRRPNKSTSSVTSSRSCSANTSNRTPAERGPVGCGCGSRRAVHSRQRSATRLSRSAVPATCSSSSQRSGLTKGSMRMSRPRVWAASNTSFSGGVGIRCRRGAARRRGRSRGQFAARPLRVNASASSAARSTKPKASTCQAHAGQPGECAVEILGELVVDCVDLDGEGGLVHGS